ncbi:low temperature requirement protein A [Nocardiopsis sp. EMB25]|uniref:low temperature requirement protein A n=1 Tax=Nocardiopsis sp. EMB25 TaxID=2835867 RepID=UPI0022841A31|nr:low temperature requirement protein A [Nocardiopsis sp. EMB25]MCY9786350.1 low temperature requirement protein A [Nocardiopsis sp. EMB25]
MSVQQTRNLLRTKDTQGHVGPVELLFDLVYVFTIIQLSHYVVAHLDVLGVAEAAVLFFAVWWGWNYTAWAMNWLNPFARGTQLLLAVLMLAALTMAIAIPEAFTERAWLFVTGYLVLQLVRSSFMVWAFRGQVMGRNYAHLLAWSAIAGVLWLVGLGFEGEARLALWALAVLIEYASPRFGFWLPGLGSTPMSSWPTTESHLAERNRLVFIIALGESILVLGGALLSEEFTFGVVAAAVVGFTTMFLLWWLYFDFRHGNAEHEYESDDVTAAARDAYAYAHALMVGGAILVAVGIEEVVHHPVGETSAWIAFTIVSGPIVYLLGNLIFQRALWRRTATSRLTGIAALLAVGVTSLWLPPLAVAVLVVAVMVALAAFDASSDRGVTTAAQNT